MTWVDSAALVLVDVQMAFEHPRWGRRDNPACDDNITALVAAFAAAQVPLVFVRHTSPKTESDFHVDRPGYELKPYAHDGRRAVPRDRHEPAR